MRLGVSMQAIQDVLYDSFGQRQISTIFSQSNQYRVVLESDPAWQSDPNSLLNLRFPGARGAQVPLTAIATIERVTAPLSVTHEQQFPSATLSFNLDPGASSATPCAPWPRPSGRSACPKQSAATTPATRRNSRVPWPASPT